MAGRTVFAFETDPPIEGMVFAFNARADKTADTRTLLASFGPVFKGHMQEQFASEGRLAGGWAALSPEYKTWKDRHYPGRPIGVLRGHLKPAMTGGAGYTEEIHSDRASYGLGGGPAAAYGRYFAKGGRGPARPVVKWGSAQVQDYRKAAHRWLSDAIKAGQAWRS